MAAKNFSVSKDKKGTYHFQGELCIHELDELKDFLEKSLKVGQEKRLPFPSPRLDLLTLRLFSCLLLSRDGWNLTLSCGFPLSLLR